MKTYKPILLTLFAAALAVPAFAVSGKSPMENVRPMYVADRDDHDHDRDRGRRREEAREHHRRDRGDDYYQDRSYRYGNNNPYYGNGNRYPNYGYGGYRYGNNSSYERGYRDGVTIGRNDYLRGYGYNPRRYDRRGDRSYRDGFGY